MGVGQPPLRLQILESASEYLLGMLCFLKCSCCLSPLVYVLFLPHENRG